MCNVPCYAAVRRQFMELGELNYLPTDARDATASARRRAIARRKREYGRPFAESRHTLFLRYVFFRHLRMGTVARRLAEVMK